MKRGFMYVTKYEWDGWRNSDTGKEFFKTIKEAADNNVEALACGGTLGDHTAEMTARLVGRIEAYRDIEKYLPIFVDEEDKDA